MLENDQLGNGNWLLTHLFLKYLVVGWENISHCTSWIVVKGNLKGNIFIEEGGGLSTCRNTRPVPKLANLVGVCI